MPERSVNLILLNDNQEVRLQFLYCSSPQQYYPDFEKNIYLADGVYQQLAFCKGGSYAYTITTDSQYSGFDVNVLPPEQDVQEFIDVGGLHYPS